MLQLLKTGEEVAKLQADLEEMRPQLEKAQIETEQTMAKIEKDSGTVCSIVYYLSLVFFLSSSSSYYYSLPPPPPPPPSLSIPTHTYTPTLYVLYI